MCTYCMISDWQFRHNPPWVVPPYPTGPVYPTGPAIPQPLPGVVVNPWNVQQLKEYLELLTRVKELEDKLGCACDAHEKPDYIRLFTERIAALEKRVEELGK